ncbi:hypothetical protein J6590_083477 [Homalodisca vitripennis]|nr:hypothetical protein J6590_060111 [Homalodisca vitripennis]KAG8334765.1 hypothetical protein J6590_083477 [Homalodisca vitripennis]
MSNKRRREASPVSEDTLFSCLQNANVRTNSNETSNYDLSSSEDSTRDLDDTEDDPTFDPANLGPSTSQTRFGLPLQTRPRLFDMSSSSDSEQNVSLGPSVTNTPRPRGRPKGSTNAIPNDSDLAYSPERIWVPVSENDDSSIRPNHDFSFNEIPGPRHCPPPDSAPIMYVLLFLTNTLKIY